MNIKRTEFSKKIDKGDGSHSVVVGINSVLNYKENYEDQNEDWKEIDAIPESKAEGIVLTKAPYNAVAKDGGLIEYFSKKKGTSLTIQLKDAANVPVEIEDNTAIWKDVFLNTDAYVVFQPTGIRLYIKLKSEDTPKFFQWVYTHDTIGKDVMGNEVLAFDANNKKYDVTSEWVNKPSTIEGKEESIVSITCTPRISIITDKKKRIRSWSDEVAYPVLIDPTVNENITTDADDDGQEQGYSSTWLPNGGGNVNTINFYYGFNNAGLRFQTIDVPQGATINSATLTVEVMTVANTAFITDKIYGDDVDDAPAFATGSLPSGVTKTTAFKAITVTDIASTGVKNLDVTNIVQEIVNRAGWTNNNDMRFAVLCQRVAGAPVWTIADTGHGTGAAATLAIDYTAGGSSFVASPLMYMMQVTGGLI